MGRNIAMSAFWAPVLAVVMISSVCAAGVGTSPLDPSATDLRSLAAQATTAKKAADQAHEEAKTAAVLYLQAAEAHCREILAGDPDYSNTAANMEVAKHDLSEARSSGDVRREMDASSRLNQAAAKAREMDEQMMRSDQDVADARAILAHLDGPTTRQKAGGSAKGANADATSKGR
jgi:hypothetical protein